MEDRFFATIAQLKSGLRRRVALTIITVETNGPTTGVRVHNADTENWPLTSGPFYQFMSTMMSTDPRIFVVGSQGIYDTPKVIFTWKVMGVSSPIFSVGSLYPHLNRSLEDAGVFDRREVRGQFFYSIQDPNTGRYYFNISEEGVLTWLIEGKEMNSALI